MNATSCTKTAACTTPKLKTVFLLEKEKYELIYGEECLREVGEKTNLLLDKPYYPSSGIWSPAISEVEIAFTGWGSPRFDSVLLDRMPSLKMVFHGAGSVRPYVTDEFWRRGIGITTAAAANAVPVAEFTVGAIILGLKSAWRLNRKACTERTYKWSADVAPGVRKATIGLVSLGLIARHVLKLLTVLDVRVVAYDPHLAPEEFKKLGVRQVSLVELMQGSDVVSLHTPLNANTQKMITGDLLRMLKPGAIFINTARGGLVREDEMITVLRDRPDVQAILDVTWPEPPAQESPLYDMENVFLTPHIAGSTGAECRRLGRAMVDELDRYIRGESLLHVLKREQADVQT